MGRGLPDRGRRLGGARDRDRGAHLGGAGSGRRPLQQPIQVRRIMESAPSTSAEMDAYLETAGAPALSVPADVEDLLRDRRRRSSARSPAAPATSTPPRTPCRRRSSRPPTTGRATGSRRTRGLAAATAVGRLIDQRRSERSRADRERASRRRSRRAVIGRRRGRHPDGPVPVLPSGADARVRDRADAARGRRPDDRPDRARVPGPRGHDGAADQPGQGDASALPGVPLRDADGRRERARPAAHGPARPLPDVQRGLRREPAAGAAAVDLSDEAIRLGRLLHRPLPDDAEVGRRSSR